MTNELQQRQRELWATEIARTLDPGAGGYFHAMLKRAALAGMEKTSESLPGLVSTLRSHADDCENMERWAVPELAPLLRRAADVIGGAS